MENKTNSNSYLMSDDMALGYFDADGGILTGTEFKVYPSGNKNLSHKVVYLTNQSVSKQETVVKFAEKFDGKYCINSGEFRANQSSPVGQKIREFLLKNNPKHPYRLRDFLISEQVILLLNTELNKVQRLAIAYLAKHKSVFKRSGSDEYFTKCCTHVDATPAEVQQAAAIGQPIISVIEKKLAIYEKTLPEMKLTDDYVLGSHYGDGSFYIALSWKPTTNSQRLRCEPEWAISGDDKTYSQAFSNVFNGRTVKVDAGGQIKFVLSGVKKCLTILPLFDKAVWMPEYKKEQYERWKKSLYLINSQEHFTEEGIRRLLDLSYDLAEKGGRKYSKEQYLEWGLAWLNSPNRQKRKPRGKDS